MKAGRPTGRAGAGGERLSGKPESSCYRRSARVRRGAFRLTYEVD